MTVRPAAGKVLAGALPPMLHFLGSVTASRRVDPLGYGAGWHRWVTQRSIVIDSLDFEGPPCRSVGVQTTSRRCGMAYGDTLDSDRPMNRQLLRTGPQ